MIDWNSIPGAQFITLIVAIAAAMTGWLTLILTNLKFRAEGAILVVQQIKSTRSGGYEIIIENVGVGVALHVVVSVADRAKVVAGGLRTGERITVRLPNALTFELLFSDARGKEWPRTWEICFADGLPFVCVRKRPNLMSRIIRFGFVAVQQVRRGGGTS